jgi:beta-N-acetylhexosaminidase
MQSLGSHFFIGIPGPTLEAHTEKLLKEIRPGGIILFQRNVQTPQQLAKLTARLRKILGARLLICLDHEGGRVNRLKELVGVIPSAQQLGFLKKVEWSRKHGELTGRLLQELGVNVNLAPVLDLHLRPKTDNSVPDRCWSRDPKMVALHAGAFLQSMQEEGVIGCGKHFIGYGAADKDPHLVLPRVDRTKSQIYKEDLKPYALLSPKKKVIKNSSRLKHLNLIMLSHAHIRAFHGNKLTPACVSTKIVQGLLRETLSFDGVAITDDLEMGAILKRMTVGEATVGCLKAGADFILICHTAKAQRDGYNSAIKAVKKGELTAEWLDASKDRLSTLHKLPPLCPTFSEKRFEKIKKEIVDFRKKVFSVLPDKLKIIDSRWGPIGEAY